jgi:predicted peroxiredoxin
MAGTGKFCVSLSVSKKDTDRARAALSVANAALKCDSETVVFLSDDGVHLGVATVSEGGIDDSGALSLRELMENFVTEGGQILINAPDFKKRHLNDDSLFKGASLVGPEQLVEFLSDGTPCVSY